MPASLGFGALIDSSEPRTRYAAERSHVRARCAGR
jgi:hypothetical protein